MSYRRLRQYPPGPDRGRVRDASGRARGVGHPRGRAVRPGRPAGPATGTAVAAGPGRLQERQGRSPSSQQPRRPVGGSSACDRHR
jgi:hypothetical protein